MRLLRNLLSKLTRPAPKRDFAHVHDVQIKWERTPIGKDDNTKNPGSMSLNGTCVRCSVGWPFLVDELVGGGGAGRLNVWFAVTGSPGHPVFISYETFVLRQSPAHQIARHAVSQFLTLKAGALLRHRQAEYIGLHRLANTLDQFSNNLLPSTLHNPLPASRAAATAKSHRLMRGTMPLRVS